MKYITWFQDAIGSIMTISEFKESKNLENFVKVFYKKKQMNVFLNKEYIKSFVKQLDLFRLYMKASIYAIDI